MSEARARISDGPVRLIGWASSPEVTCRASCGHGIERPGHPPPQCDRHRNGAAHQEHESDQQDDDQLPRGRVQVVAVLLTACGQLVVSVVNAVRA